VNVGGVWLDPSLHRMSPALIDKMHKDVSSTGFFSQGVACTILTADPYMMSPSRRAPGMDPSLQYRTAAQVAYNAMSLAEKIAVTAKEGQIILSAGPTLCGVFLSTEGWEYLDELRLKAYPTTPGHHLIKRTNHLSHLLDFLDWAQNDLGDQSLAVLGALKGPLRRYLMSCKLPSASSRCEVTRFSYIDGKAIHASAYDIWSTDPSGVIRLFSRSPDRKLWSGIPIEEQGGELCMTAFDSWKTVYRLMDKGGNLRAICVRIGLPMLILDSKAVCMDLDVYGAYTPGRSSRIEWSGLSKLKNLVTSHAINEQVERAVQGYVEAINSIDVSLQDNDLKVVSV